MKIICSNVPESKANSIKDRLLDDMKQWESICRAIGMQPKQASLCRIIRHLNSLHYGEQRLLQVTLQSGNEAETVLLSAHRLRDSSCGVRIFPDISWSERRQRKQNPGEHRKQTDERSIFVHGVPETQAPEESQVKAHDLEEWRYFREAPSLHDVIASSTSRLPISPNYKGSGPRVLKVLLYSKQTVETVLGNWHKFRTKLPSEIRLKAVGTRPPMDKGTRNQQEVVAIPAVCISVPEHNETPQPYDEEGKDSLLQIDSGRCRLPTVMAPGSLQETHQKNVPQPTQQGSA
ncbi:unnamed protein product [Dicrocoelium dendriticum]|nr:unnamed protein product [Dicrocoelium dendriticum]